ncbi:MAG: hypothetical protein IIC01_09120, partial [Planctomycetes bacterium]|nr:hypothetical protein [Planctomycetota bacterium]
MRSGPIQRNGISCILVALTTVVGLVGAAQAGSLRVIAKYGDPAPGSEGNFRTFLQLGGADPAISGRNIAFGASIDGGGGVYAYIDGKLRVIADTNTPMPGTSGNFGFLGSEGGSPSISGRNVAFGAAAIATGSIWMYRDGSLINIADVNTPVPGGTGTFSNFGLGHGVSPSISGENVAFAGVSSETSGIYAYINGELRVIADTNTLVPGAPSPRTFMNFGQLGGVSPSISGENVAFKGVWLGGGGVYAYINGSLRVIADTTTTGVSGVGPSIHGENVA